MPVASRPAARRRPTLRLLPLEDRTVPTTSAVGMNFSGGFGNQFAPPDTDGCVGPNDYVQFINGQFAVYSKADGNPRVTEGDDQFWNLAGISSAITNQGVSDPRVVYDPLTNRWFASEINTPNLGNVVLVGRSETADPAGAWRATSYLAVDANTFGDYDTLGVDANGVYIGTVNFSTTAMVSSTLTSIPKADLLQSPPTVSRRTTRTDTNFTMGDILQGVNNFNAGQTPSSHASVVSADHNFFSLVDRTTLTGTGGSGASFGPTTNINVQATSFPDLAHQPDGSQVVDAIDDRFGSRVWQVGDLIIGAHDIQVGSRDAIRITVLSDSQNAVVAEATISDSTYDYIDPSVAMNQYGDMVIGFTRSGLGEDGTLGAYCRYASIDPANPAAGITVDPTSVELQAGLVGDYHLFGGGLERWGDYSATDVDPTDPTSFWTTQEWAVDGGFSSTWATQVSEVGVSPRVTGVTSPATNGTYGVGQVIPITVTFNHAVSVSGVPQLALNAGAGAKAVYATGSGTNVLTFNYTVGAGQNAADLNYQDAAALTLNGGTITRTGTANPDANLTLPNPAGPGSLGGSKNFVIDTRPRVASGGVSSPLPDGTYGTDEVIPITVTFTSPVDVTGAPRLALALDAGPPAVATYAGGSGTATLTFNYTVVIGQMAADLDYASAGALTLNGGTIKDHTGGADAALTLPAPGTAGSLGANKNIDIDTRSPKIADVTSPTPDGTYGFGQVIQVVITFDQPADVTGVPELALNAGPGAKAVYVSGSGTNTLTFAYTVGLADVVGDLNYASATALSLPNGATIKQAAGTVDATLTLPAPTAPNSLGGNKDLDIDGRPGQPLDVTSSQPNGLYSVGAVIPITVTFTKPVVVDTTGGAPTLALSSGGTATYAGTSGTFTQLAFTYTVQAGDQAADLDAAGVGALALNGATLTDLASGTPAPLAVPVGADPHSLATNKNLVIDATAPKVVEFRVLFGNRWYNLVGAARVDLPWRVSAIQVVFDKPIATANVRSLSGLSPRRLTGLRTNTLTWRFTTPITRGTFAAGIVTTGANAVKDVAGNPVEPFGQAFTVLYGDFNGDHVVDAADQAGVRAAQGGPYQPGSVGYNLFADLSGDGLVNLVDVGITRTRKGTHL